MIRVIHNHGDLQIEKYNLAYDNDPYHQTIDTAAFNCVLMSDCGIITGWGYSEEKAIEELFTKLKVAIWNKCNWIEEER